MAERENYTSIQYLRAIAALLVVLHHARNPTAWLFNPLEQFHGFARGVDIFFVISGFIMAAIGAKESPSEFAKKRLIRVAPIYWMGTILVTMQIGLKLGFDKDLIQHFLLSLSFVPHLNHEGEIFPILIPGWTLNYEMFFYGIFCLCLLTKQPVRICFLALLSLTALGLLHPMSAPAPVVYTNVKLTEFAAGLLLGAYRHTIVKKPWLAALMPVGIGTLFLSHHWAMTTAGALMIVASALAAEKFTKTFAPLKALGDASYFLYISHPFAIGVSYKLWSKVPLTGAWQFVDFLATAIILSCAVGILGHFIIEKPLTRFLQRKFVQKRSRPSPSTNPGVAASSGG